MVVDLDAIDEQPEVAFAECRITALDAASQGCSKLAELAIVQVLTQRRFQLPVQRCDQPDQLLYAGFILVVSGPEAVAVTPDQSSLHHIEQIFLC
jgi:hypothetical protein